MKKYIKRQWKSFKCQWDGRPETRLKLLWMAFLIWVVLSPVLYILLFAIGLLTWHNPFKFASEAINEIL